MMISKVQKICVNHPMKSLNLESSGRGPHARSRTCHMRRCLVLLVLKGVDPIDDLYNDDLMLTRLARRLESSSSC